MLRVKLSGELSFEQMLERVRQVALEAYSHQELPFERLVQAVRPGELKGRLLVIPVIATRAMGVAAADRKPWGVQIAAGISHGAALKAFGRARRFADFRVMLDEMPDIDAVVVATPDHAHAVIANAAMKAGKHVYVQKPLTWSVYEARVLLDTARKTGVVTQMGNQGHSTAEAYWINDLLRGGVIGTVRDVHCWTNRPIWPQGMPLPATPEQLAEFAAEAREDEDEHFLNWRRWNQTLRYSMALPAPETACRTRPSASAHRRVREQAPTRARVPVRSRIRAAT